MKISERDFDVIHTEAHVWTVGYRVDNRWHALEDFSTRYDAEHRLFDIQSTGLYVDRSEPGLYTVYDTDTGAVRDFRSRNEALVWAHGEWRA